MLEAAYRKLLYIIMFYCVSIQANNKSCGCGQNPLRTLQSASQTLGIVNVKDAMNLIESDRETWGEFIGLLQAYDDCIRTRGGVRYRKKSSEKFNEGFDFRRDFDESYKLLVMRLMKLQATNPEKSVNGKYSQLSM